MKSMIKGWTVDGQDNRETDTQQEDRYTTEKQTHNRKTDRQQRNRPSTEKPSQQLPPKTPSKFFKINFSNCNLSQERAEH
jgi:hypothetical protein